jgi:hypothetical protein
VLRDELNQLLNLLQLLRDDVKELLNLLLLHEFRLQEMVHRGLQLLEQLRHLRSIQTGDTALAGLLGRESPRQRLRGIAGRCSDTL